MGHKVKLYENLYPQVYDWDNLLLSYRRASKGKRRNPAVAAFEYHLEDNLIRLQTEWRDKNRQGTVPTNMESSRSGLRKPGVRARPAVPPRG